MVEKVMATLSFGCHKHQLKINSQVYQGHVRVVVHKLKFKRSWVMQQVNDPKHQSRFTTMPQSEPKPQPNTDTVE
ncbi:hypothetical protein EXN66_Car005335 [Channa argus]|uniref:Uncharacterized protein n=1 Tax=Channa argus TaxID=215402 RepID=A0A6G1PHI8_CHAAH|nr:hypothetical protein EXN66_Car005335 [Channa argus]